MEGLIVGIIAGAIASWAITHFYYRRSSSDLAIIGRKLSDELKAIILADKRDSLDVAELNELLTKKTIRPGKEGIHRYVACPKCGSPKLVKGTDYVVDTDEDCRVPYDNVSCQDCGWKESDVDREKLKRPL